jgi:UDP-N-acetylmuramoyl-L-alanine---L-glutamate ligase
LSHWERIKESLVKLYSGKRILILGFGKEGISTYRLLQTLELDVPLTIMDQNSEVVVRFLAQNNDIKTIVSSDEAYLQNLDSFDCIFKTPGLPSYLLEGIGQDKLTSQSQLFMTYLSTRTIGITGTKGKSTTSSIIKHVLEGAGLKIKLIGNIGNPALESLMEDDEETYYVYEMSSFQTEFLKDGPKYRVILNLFQEHLNNYTGYDAYQQSKLQLFRADSRNDDDSICVYGCDNTTLLEKITKLKQQLHVTEESGSFTSVDLTNRAASKRAFHAFGYLSNNVLNDDGFFIHEGMIIQREKGVEIPVTSAHFSRKVLGEHNLVNCLVSFIMAEVFKKEGIITIPLAQLIELIGTFKGLHHRLEEVGAYHEITFYNDSISTIPEATIRAVEAIKSIGTLIIGGFDRTIDYSSFAKYLIELNQSTQVSLICLPTTGHKIAEMMGNPKYCYRVQSMEEAVQLSYTITPPQKACLLSPAASSFNQYKNFEDRGDHFVECVKTYGELKEEADEET